MYREKQGGGRGVVHCRLQCDTAATLAGAGEVLDQMVARAQTWPKILKFGGCVEGREGVLGMCSGGQGEVLWCTKWKWSSDVLFLNSNFENLIGAMW